MATPVATAVLAPPERMRAQVGAAPEPAVAAGVRRARVARRGRVPRAVPPERQVGAAAEARQVLAEARQVLAEARQVLAEAQEGQQGQQEEVAPVVEPAVPVLVVPAASRPIP